MAQITLRGNPINTVGELPVVYANVVSVTRDGGRARIRFGFQVPGEKGARAVADVVVAGEVLGQLR